MHNTGGDRPMALTLDFLTVISFQTLNLKATDFKLDFRLAWRACSFNHTLPSGLSRSGAHK